MDTGLHTKQLVAFMSPATEILYGGAAGGGKSHLFRIAAISWCSQIAGIQIYIFRRTYPDLWKNHMEGPTGFPALLAEWEQNKWVKINHGDGAITFWNGAKIFLCHCQYDKDVTKYQGAEMHVLFMDELTHFSAYQYRFLRGRVRMTGVKLPEQYANMFPRILSGTNPGGIGHNWVKATFIDNTRPLEMRRMPRKEGGMIRQFIPALLDDNPTLLEGDPNYEARLEGLGNDALVRAMRMGDWNIVSGGMFDDVWDEKLHVIEPFKIPFSWRIDRAFDWGSSKPFSIGWWAESDGTPVIVVINGTRVQRTFPRGTLILIAEWYGWNGEPNVGLRMLAKDIAIAMKEREKFFGDDRVKAGPADSSIWDVENGSSIVKDFTDNGIKFTPANKSPGSRKHGWEKMRKMLKAAYTLKKGRPMEEPGLFVFSTCRQWIRTVPTLVRDERDPDDVDTKSEDHCGDMTRYRAMANSSSLKVTKIKT